MTRTCSVVDSIDCEASTEGLVIRPVVTCWACGDDTCLACSSVISYPWHGQRRRIRFCFNCQDQRGVGRAEKERAA